MDYLKQYSTQETLKILQGLAQRVSEIYPSPKVKDLSDLAQRGDWLSLANYDFSYNSSDSYDEVVACRQILGFFSKLETLPLNLDREKVAYEKFLESERICAETNRRIRTRLPPIGRVSSVIAGATWKIAGILGPLPALSALAFEFGPGATTSAKATRSSARCKLSCRLECSRTLAPSLGAFLSEAPLLAAHHASSENEDFYTVDVRVVPGKLMFVPKTAKTLRSIIVEPHLNGFFQKGVGTYLKGRLRQVGLDLSDQEANRRLARIGSETDAYATVDLSMASDTIAYETVFDLLPLDWASFLAQLRTSCVVAPDGSLLELQKFSSMGNAFTFELETLIFASLARECVSYLGLDGSVSVYGDDIIIPSDAYDLLKEVFDYYGFLVNETKSYGTGPFRESCGADWFLGRDVRPLYVKENLTVRALFAMHNWFVRHAESQLAEAVRDLIPDHLALYGPDGYGDGHLIGNYELRSSRKLKRAGWCGGFFDTYTLKPRRFRTRLPGDWVYPSYSVYTRSGKYSPTDPDIIRGSKGYAKISIYTLATGVFR